MRKFLIVVLFLAIFATVLKANTQEHTGLLEKNWTEAPTDIPAPELNFVYQDGRAGTLADFRGKRAVVVNFWATWCAPCRAEMPTLQALAGRVFENGATPVVLAVGLENDFDTASKFLDDLGAKDVTIVLDRKGKAFRGLSGQGLGLDQLRGLPVTLLISKSGTMLGHVAGPADWDSAFARELVRQAQE